MQHLGGDDLSALNNDQRIILASHRFAPEVTSAALWLNDKAHGEDLITCVTLTPYRDASAGSLYIQATTIIPVPGEEDYVIGIGSNAANLRRASTLNRNDKVTAFARKVGQLALQGLPDAIRPDKRSRWAEGSPGRSPLPPLVLPGPVAQVRLVLRNHLPAKNWINGGSM